MEEDLDVPSPYLAEGETASHQRKSFADILVGSLTGVFQTALTRIRTPLSGLGYALETLPPIVESVDHSSDQIVSSSQQSSVDRRSSTGPLPPFGERHSSISLRRSSVGGPDPLQLARRHSSLTGAASDRRSSVGASSEQESSGDVSPIAATMPSAARVSALAEGQDAIPSSASGARPTKG